MGKIRIGEVRAYFQDAEFALQKIPLRKKEKGGERIHCRLFELDIKEMFPCLPRSRVTEALRNIAEAIVEALERTEWGGRRVRLQSSGIRFAIHKRNRRLDMLLLGLV